MSDIDKLQETVGGVEVRRKVGSEAQALIYTQYAPCLGYCNKLDMTLHHSLSLVMIHLVSLPL